MTPDRLADLRELLAALDVPAMVIGGLAVAVRGRPRMTLDADVTIAADPANLPQILETAASCGFEPRVSDPPAFVQQTRVLPLQRRADGWEVDLVFAGSLYEEEAIGRATLESLGTVTLPVIGAEDLVIHKLLAGRPRDLEDAASVLERQGDEVDRDWVRRLLLELARALADDELARRTRQLLGSGG